MAHGLSLELAEIKAPEWQPVDAAEWEAARQAKAYRLPKKFRNRLWRSLRKYAEATGMTRQEFLVRLRKGTNEQL